MPNSFPDTFLMVRLIKRVIIFSVSSFINFYSHHKSLSLILFNRVVYGRFKNIKYWVFFLNVSAFDFVDKNKLLWVPYVN